MINTSEPLLIEKKNFLSVDESVISISNCGNHTILMSDKKNIYGTGSN